MTIRERLLTIKLASKLEEHKGLAESIDVSYSLNKVPYSTSNHALQSPETHSNAPNISETGN